MFPMTEKRLRRTVNATVEADRSGGYVVSCVELPVVTQGDTFDELLRNLEEAVYLALSHGDAAATYGLAEDVSVMVTYELGSVRP